MNLCCIKEGRHVEPPLLKPVTIRNHYTFQILTQLQLLQSQTCTNTVLNCLLTCMSFKHKRQGKIYFVKEMANFAWLSPILSHNWNICFYIWLSRIKTGSDIKWYMNKNSHLFELVLFFISLLLTHNILNKLKILLHILLC